ncbi:MAG: circularly permuted type 2 ATP-grasp protein [Propionibacteriaceae bacterium]|nr:circularly permuted type 2 ATP-grasp protein [Propionibacteriaceae bacterium]
MTAEAIDDISPLTGQYAERLDAPNPALPLGTPRGLDELVADGQVRPSAALLEEALTRFGTIGLQTRRRTVERLIADDGITYGAGTDAGGPRPWQLDPLPFILDAAEWATLERGLEQRARLLDALFRDLVGPNRLLTERIIPAEIIAAHPGFLLPAHGITPPTTRAIPATATDLARTPDGWTVVSDRTQSPSGAGYAMANRRIIARAMEGIHRKANLRRLRGWFDLVQIGIHDAAPPTVEDVPRVVLLTPGPGSETAFDQGMLSTLLGHPLAQSDDLVMRGGRLWLRTMGRLEAVDVVLRRVDANWCDSLDLLASSRLGVPGLVAAARRGTVAVVNPLRAAILENPGLFPFQDAIARTLLGEELQLSVPDTWWCGDATSRQHVLANLGRLIIKPLARSRGEHHLLGWQLSTAQQAELADRIQAEPWSWVGQEPITTSTAPLVTAHGLQPRNIVLRAFGMAVGETYHFLPGGLARIASAPDAFSVTNASGASAKDVWVLDGDDATPARVDLAALARARTMPSATRLPGLTPRTASNLYWLGRYAERAEVAARLLLVADNLVEDHHTRSGTPGHAAMQVVLEAISAVTTALPGFTGSDAEARLADPLPVLEKLLLDERVAGGVAHGVQKASSTALQVREVLSMNTPSVLSRLQRVLAEAREEESIPVQLTSERILDSLLALAGITAESLVRDATWAFLDAGRRMERAQSIVRLLRNTIAITRSPVVEGQVVEAVLRVGDSLITHRRRQAAGVGPAQPAASALDILVVDSTNPRSVAFQLDHLAAALAHAPDIALTERLQELRRSVREVDVDALIGGERLDLVDTLIGLEQELRAFSDAMESTHFSSQAPQSSFAVAELSGGRR